ncbi:MAG: 30S ribosomal protein S4 [Candidatus Chisholmbacteria bacterium]|nr:30S ribosomal protein S4 [Candidatus Chisholmbacteria bacterium]
MARYTGPKNKLARRAGSSLELKTNATKLQRRLGILPGTHGRKGKRKVSDFGEQLAEKQKLKWAYGLLERQFRRYFTKAAKAKGVTGEMLLSLLERRLDNVVYRLSFAPTRAAARQLVSHGHVRVNNHKISIPSYQVKPEDIITLSAKALNIPTIKELASQKPVVPKWLARKAAVGKISRLPQRDDITVDVNEQLIIEYYSR